MIPKQYRQPPPLEGTAAERSCRMADNRRYYYLKLKDNYFDEDSIVLLESMKDGMLYSNILLKLYLKSLKNGGKLQLDEHIPYTAEMIATITRHQIGTVERALQIFLQLGLVEVMENGGYYMSNIELLIGQSSTEGERKKRARMEIKAQKPHLPDKRGQTSGQMADICPPEIERELEIKREIELERESEGKTGQSSHTPGGRYGNVVLTPEEYAELKADFPEDCDRYIDRLSQYIASSGKEYKSHSATIRYWITTDRRRGILKQGSRNYDCGEDESL